MDKWLHFVITLINTEVKPFINLDSPLCVCGIASHVSLGEEEAEEAECRPRGEVSLYCGWRPVQCAR